MSDEERAAIWEEVERILKGSSVNPDNDELKEAWNIECALEECSMEEMLAYTD